MRHTVKYKHILLCISVGGVCRMSTWDQSRDRYNRTLLLSMMERMHTQRRCRSLFSSYPNHPTTYCPICVTAHTKRQGKMTTTTNHNLCEVYNLMCASEGLNSSDSWGTYVVSCLVLVLSCGYLVLSCLVLWGWGATLSWKCHALQSAWLRGRPLVRKNLSGTEPRYTKQE